MITSHPVTWQDPVLASLKVQSFLADQTVTVLLEPEDELGVGGGV